MGLGDLLNLDYGFALDGGPAWNFPTSGYSFGGPELTNAEILGDQFGMGPMRGTDFSLGAAGYDDMDGMPTAMRPSVFEMNGRGDWTALGHRGGDGMVQTLDGNPVAANPFNVNLAGGGALKNLMDALKGVSPGGGGQGGGGNTGLALPKFETPQAPQIARLGYEAPSVPQPAGFTPLSVDVMPKGGDLSALAALLKGAR
ncbi:MAG TPA: hypothetical protein VD970_16310 [Acetobacteraceae bacterium]|nr:hypothetical protein [Acetobacteraceae bacterium]